MNVLYFCVNVVSLFLFFFFLVSFSPALPSFNKYVVFSRLFSFLFLSLCLLSYAVAWKQGGGFLSPFPSTSSFFFFWSRISSSFFFFPLFFFFWGKGNTPRFSVIFFFLLFSCRSNLAHLKKSVFFLLLLLSVTLSRRFVFASTFVFFSCTRLRRRGFALKSLLKPKLPHLFFPVLIFCGLFSHLFLI